jgi:hypothetical protein
MSAWQIKKLDIEHNSQLYGWFSHSSCFSYTDFDKMYSIENVILLEWNMTEKKTNCQAQNSRALKSEYWSKATFRSTETDNNTSAPFPLVTPSAYFLSIQ